MLYSLLLPAMNSARVAEVRLDRQMAALQCVEAIRLYAGTHDGALPESLEAMVDSPAPVDPVTGEPFSYEVEGKTARLSAPLIPGAPEARPYRIDYELRVAE